MVSLARSSTDKLDLLPRNKPDVVSILLSCHLFSELDAQELEAMAPLFKNVPMSAGDWIFLEGAEASNLYVVVDGCVDIFKESAQGRQVRVAVRRGGSAFGEMALLDGEPRSASVRCSEDGHLLLLSQRAFNDLLERHPSAAVKILRHMAHQLSQRLRQATGLMADHLDQG